MRRRSSIAVDLGFILFGALVIGFEYASNAKGFAVAALLGGFAAYLIIFDDDSARRHGDLARMLVGASVGLAIGFMSTSSYVAWLVLAALGSALGYLGRKWAVHI
jgi:hypothetical protein